jgi:hypothetical protein
MEAAKFYPIVFTGEDQLMPLAILGLEQKNYFIDEKNNWQDRAYIPAYIRKYPFLFVENPVSKQLTLCVDEDAPHFVMDAKEEASVAKFYDNQGTPTKFVRNALAFCLSIQQDYDITRQFCEIIHSLDLLVANKVDATLPGGQMLSLGGFRQIDQQKFDQLPDEKIVELHRKGWLPLIYYMFLSNTNWKSLLDMTPRRNEDRSK